MGKFIKKVVLFGIIFSALTILSSKVSKAWYMRPIEICTNPSSVVGVAEIRDNTGASRYVRLGQGQFSTSSYVRSHKTGCSLFWGWGTCLNYKGDWRDGDNWVGGEGDKRSWFNSHGETFPVIGYKNYASTKSFSHWGCNQDPINMYVHSETYDCTSASWSGNNDSCHWYITKNLTCWRVAYGCGEVGCGSCTSGLTCYNSQCCRDCGGGVYACGSGCVCPKTCGETGCSSGGCTSGLE